MGRREIASGLSLGAEFDFENRARLDAAARPARVAGRDTLGGIHGGLRVFDGMKRSQTPASKLLLTALLNREQVEADGVIKEQIGGMLT